MSKSKVDTPFITDYDVHLFAEGNHYRIYEKLGAHEGEQDGKKGTHFSVWAPGAMAVSGSHRSKRMEAGRDENGTHRRLRSVGLFRAGHRRRHDLQILHRFKQPACV